MDKLLSAIWEVIYSQIISKPQLFLSLIVMIGYILLKKPLTKVIGGGIKTAVGVMILQAGAEQLVQAFQPLLLKLSLKFEISGTINDPYQGFSAALDALAGNVSWVGYTLLIALGTNLLIVALTKMRGLFLTGQIMFMQTAVATAIVSYNLGLGFLPTVLIAGILVGLYWAAGTHLLIEPTNTVTNHAGFTIGHQQMLMDWLASKFGHHFGNPNTEDCETKTLPGWLSIFQESIVGMSIIMIILTFALMTVIGVPAGTGFFQGESWFINTLVLGCSFVVYMIIILTGVRLFINELEQSFGGISKKLLKGAVIGVDIPAIMPYSPNAWLLGFLFTTLGNLLAVALLLFSNIPIVVLPGFIPSFFDGGAVGVYANKHGGFKAVTFFCILTGLTQILGAALIIPMSGLQGGWMGTFDWSTIWLGLTALLRLLGKSFGLDIPMYQ